MGVGPSETASFVMRNQSGKEEVKEVGNNFSKSLVLLLVHPTVCEHGASLHNLYCKCSNELMFTAYLCSAI